MTAAVRVDGVSHAFRQGEEQLLALHNVSLELKTSEFTCLVGASGSGKSTLLNLVAGLDPPTTGRIETFGSRTALLFQEASLFPWLTAAANVALPFRLRHVGREECREASRQLLSVVGLADFGGSHPHELSGGMRQRVALAQALAQAAPILLMDEPFGALDAITRDLLHDELERIWMERRLTILFVTHNAREAVRLGDRVLVFSCQPGRVVAEFRINLPRPRRLESLEVARLAGLIGDRLREEVLGRG